MRIKHLLLTAGLLTIASSASLSAAPVEYKIPATQDEFEAQWEVVAGEVDGTWEYVAGDTPYARITPVNEGEKGAALIYATPVTLKAGDVVYVQANVSSEDYYDDEWVYIVYGTDKSTLADMKDDYSSFKCWGKQGGGVNFSYKPSDTSSLRELKITEDGDYYFGVRSKKHSATSSAKSIYLACAGIKVEKSVNYPQKVTGASAKVDADGKLEVTLEWTWPTKNKDGDAIAEPLGANIYRSQSSDKAEIYTEASLIATVTDGVAGEKATFVDNATNSNPAISVPGKYYYYVAPFNAAGENSEYTSSSRIDCKWVGEDEKPLNPLNVVAKAAGDNVEVSFEKRILQGYNGGWINPEKYAIVIARQKNGAGDFVVIEDAYKGESPYVDTNLDGPATYTYSVWAVYNGQKSSETKSKAIFAGGAFDVPYSQTFDASADFNLFTVFGDNNSYKWAYSSSDNAAIFSGGYSEYNSTMVVPPLKLEAGVPYVISCDAWVSTVVDDSGDEGGEDPDPWNPWEDYSVSATPKATTATHNNVLRFLIGQEATEAGLKEIDVVDINKKSTDKVACKVFFSVETSGNYYIGLKAATKGYSDKKYVDNIKVEVSKTIPAAVADFKAGTNLGADEAKISFTLPAKTNTGTALSSLTKAVVTRYDVENVATVVKTIEGDDATPGAAVAFTDALPASGKYSYAVVCYLGEDASDAVTTEAVWYGYDIPKSVSSFSISVNTDGADPVVTWTALNGTAKGMNGGYVDDANLKYRVYRRQYMADKAADDSYTLVEEVSDCSFTDSETADLEWSKYYYSICVVNGDKEGARAESSRSAVLGDGVLMPYEHDFTNEKSFEIFEGRGWYSEKDNANECYIYSANDRGETAGKEYTIYFPPFRSNNGINLGCRVNFGLSRTNADTEENVEVYLCTLESDKPSIESGAESNPEAATIAGEDNREIVTTLPVTAAANDPQIENVKFNLPATGRYRIALRLASPDSKGVNLHSFSMENNLTSTGIDGIGVDVTDNEAVYYNLQGIRIEKPANGIYIRRTAGKSEKVVIR